jgi:hypothetical protein
LIEHWTEDKFTPRVDTLSADFSADGSTLPVAHPEWFRSGDIIRVGEQDLYDTGQKDEWGNPILRARNEAVLLIEPSTMRIQRAFGAGGAQAKPKGERVFIIASQAKS